MHVFVVLAFVPSFVISLSATAVMRRVAPRCGLVDQPAERKMHAEPVPLGGGVAIWFAVVVTLSGVLLAIWLASQFTVWRHGLPEAIVPHLSGALAQTPRLAMILAAGTLLMILGLLDDRRNLGYRSRLLVQVLVASALAAGGIRLSLFMQSPWLPGVITVVWIVVLVNAFNFLDNMDGLSSGVACIAAVLMAVVMLQSGGRPHLFVAGLLMVFAGAVAGFLCHNWPPARIFMGDAGSYFVGLMMAVATVLGTFHEPGMPDHAIFSPLCVLAVPLYDATSVVCIRLAQGRSPFLPDRSHFSHRLVGLDMSPLSAVLTIYLATLATGLGALLLYQMRHWSGAVIVFAMVVCVLGVVAILETAAHRSNGKAGE